MDGGDRPEMMLTHFSSSPANAQCLDPFMGRIYTIGSLSSERKDI